MMATDEEKHPQGCRQQQTQQLQLFVPKTNKKTSERSNYLVMLNNFASDLDVLLNDPSQPCSLTESTLIVTGNQQTTTHQNQKQSGNTVLYDHGDLSNLDERNNSSRGIMPILLDFESRSIDFRERLDKSLPIWYLPSIGRIGAVHLLKDGLPGMFIVRESSRKDAMALSVHLNQESGPIVEHYLIENYNTEPHLQGALKTFSNVPDLIYNYSQNLEDLPELLILPEPIMNAKTSQQLASLALLGQEFWSSALLKKSVSAFRMKQERIQKKQCATMQNMPTASEGNLQKRNHSQEKTSNAKNEQKLPTVLIDSIPRIEHNEDRFMKLFSMNKKNTHLVSMKNDCKAVQKVKSSCSDSHLPILQKSLTDSQPYNKNNDINNTAAGFITAKVHRSNTHPRINMTSKEKKCNLYLSTSIDLLTTHQYFCSNLSDKLSDYEDVWKNSPTKTLDAGFFKKPPDKFPIQRTVPTDVDPPSEDLYTLSTHDARFKKFASENIYTKKAHKVKIKRTTFKIDDQISGSCHSRNNPEICFSKTPLPNNLNCNVCRRGSTGQILSGHKETVALAGVSSSQNAPNQKTHPLSFTDSSSCSSLDNSDVEFSLRIPEKIKPSALPAMNQAPKISPPNLKSPVYSEPFDSIGIQPIIVPPASSNIDLTKLKSKPTPRERKKNRASQQPNLETIYSPSIVPNPTFFSFDKYKIQNGKTSNHLNNNNKQHTHIDRDKQKTKSGAEYTEGETLHLNSKFTENFLEVINNCDIKTSANMLHKFPVYDKVTLNSKGSETDCSTLGDMVRRMSPELTLEPMYQCGSVFTRASEYDNLQSRAMSVISDTGTVFSKPWDSTKWDNLLSCNDPKLLPAINPLERIQVWRESSQDYDLSQRHSQLEGPASPSSVIPASVKAQRLEQKVMQEILAGVEDSEKNIFSSKQSKLFEEHLHSSKSPGENLKEYILRLSKDPNYTFGLAIKNFVECTLESQEQNPRSVMSNIRQFMTGIKNYLLHNSQEGLKILIERESSRLGTNEILNIDAIIESALHECVILPLKEHVYQLLASDYTRNGSISVLYDNIVYARTRPLCDLGLRGHLNPPVKEDLDEIRDYLGQIQLAYSPIKKLDNLLRASSCITNYINGNERNGRTSCSVQTDDFLPMLTYVIVNTGLVSAEIEADYMWGLLLTSQVSAEANYYLSTLSSAVLLLKNFKSMHENQSGHFGRIPCISDMQGFLKVAFPDEVRHSIIWKTLPVRPNMTTRDVCAMIAHKVRITNPQDYDLFILINGQEKPLNETVCPQNLKMETINAGKDCVFAFKRKAANIAWPRKFQAT